MSALLENNIFVQMFRVSKVLMTIFTQWVQISSDMVIVCAPTKPNLLSFTLEERL